MKLSCSCSCSYRGCQFFAAYTHSHTLERRANEDGKIAKNEKLLENKKQKKSQRAECTSARPCYMATRRLSLQGIWNQRVENSIILPISFHSILLQPSSHRVVCALGIVHAGCSLWRIHQSEMELSAHCRSAPVCLCARELCIYPALIETARNGKNLIKMIWFSSHFLFTLNSHIKTKVQIERVEISLVQRDNIFVRIVCYIPRATFLFLFVEEHKGRETEKGYAQNCDTIDPSRKSTGS